MLHVFLATITLVIMVVVWYLRKFSEKVPVAWVVDGDKEIHIAWERRRNIIGTLDKLIKEVEKAEERKEKIKTEINSTLSDLYERLKKVEIQL